MTDLHETPMPVALFDEVLGLHGADLSRWPLAHIKPALALMAADDAVRQRFDNVRRLDDDLRLADAETARRLLARHGESAPQLQDNVMRRLRGETVVSTPAAAVISLPQRAAVSLRAFFAPIGSLLIIGLIGFVMGVQQPANADDSLLDGLVHGQEIVISGDQPLTGGL